LRYEGENGPESGGRRRLFPPLAVESKKCRKIKENIRKKTPGKHFLIDGGR